MHDSMHDVNYYTFILALLLLTSATKGAMRTMLFVVLRSGYNMVVVVLFRPVNKLVVWSLTLVLLC
jgi:hypothetical protein